MGGGKGSGCRAALRGAFSRATEQHKTNVLANTEVMVVDPTP